MNDLAQIKRQNAQAERAAKYPSRVGAYRLKAQPRHQGNQKFAAVYTNRKGKEFFLSLAACTDWEQNGDLPETGDLIPFSQ